MPPATSPLKGVEPPSGGLVAATREGGAVRAIASDRAKRVMDIGLALLTTPLWLPLLAIVAVLVRWKLGAPIFFRQLRPGFRGRPFHLLKFRTMTVECDAEGRLLPDAQRLKSFGRWLRSTSLDELPELINVLRGEMSLVGPRPLLMQYLERYSPHQARRHEVVPGITGWAQVHGRNAISWEDKFRFDVWYVDHRSFWLDLKILALTVLEVLRREGVTAAGDATMPEFMGTTIPVSGADKRFRSAVSDHSSP